MINPERLYEGFVEALELENAAERDKFLASLGATDPEMQERLSSLLAAHRNAADFLERPVVLEAAGLIPERLGSRLLGQQIGSWHVDELLGTGGMGGVYRATRVGAGFTQSGALKVVRIGFETDDLLKRFTKERQLLASIEHPHIARFLDGGTTEEGLPWFAMEFVEGTPIDEFCDKHALDLAERLALFDQLASAIAYLHQSLIVHRDIKFSNVLVDRNGHPRVLDFGIANLVSESSAPSEERHRMSFATAAPEQLRGEPVSTATDIYSLGLLLYQLLSGRAPYTITQDMSFAKVEAIVCAELPPLASTSRRALPSLAHGGGRTGLNVRSSELSGDIDLILAKALEKDPLKRYGSVAELREDLARFSQRRPVLARPQTTAYLVGRFAQRYWRGLSATLIALISLVSGLALALSQAEEARQQRDRAQAMNRFMGEVLESASPFVSNSDRTVRDALKDASRLLDHRFEGQPLLEASLRQSVGGVQVRLMDLEQGEANLTRSLELATDNKLESEAFYLEAKADLAWSLYERGELEEAIDLYEWVIDAFDDRHPTPLKRVVFNDLGVALNRAGYYAQALDALETSLLYAENKERQIAATKINMAYAYGYLERLEEARSQYNAAINSLESFGEEGQTASLAYAYNNFGRVLAKLGDERAAIEVYLKSLDLRKRVFGAESDSVGAQHLSIGRLYIDMDEPEFAKEHLMKASELLSDFRADDTFYRMLAVGSLAYSELLIARDRQQMPSPVHRENLKNAFEWFQSQSSPAYARFTKQLENWLDSDL